MKENEIVIFENQGVKIGGEYEGWNCMAKSWTNDRVI
jgi:hypothetical protein